MEPEFSQVEKNSPDTEEYPLPKPPDPPLFPPTSPLNQPRKPRKYTTNP